MRAPSDWDRSFSQATVGATIFMLDTVANPQSVPAITFSRPTTSA
jgi:hypothetical protein